MGCTWRHVRTVQGFSLQNKTTQKLNGQYYGSPYYFWYGNVN